MVAKGDREGGDGMGVEGLGLSKDERVGSRRVRMRAKVGAGGEEHLKRGGLIRVGVSFTKGEIMDVDWAAEQVTVWEFSQILSLSLGDASPCHPQMG